MAKTIKAQIAPVTFGGITIEGLMAEDGTFVIAVVQICELFQFSRKNSSRELKALLPEGFQFAKVQTKLNSKAINVLSLSDFELVLFKLICAGNQKAQSFGQDLIGLSLHQIFCDAFGRKFEAEDRKAFLIQRAESKDLFFALTNEIKRWTENRECSAPVWSYYSNAFDAINLGLFGKKSAKIKEELGLTSSEALCRDHFGRNALRHLTQVQELASRMMINDSRLKPVEAVKEAIRVNLDKIQDYRN